MNERSKKGNALVDLIVGVIILGIVSASVGTAYSSLINRTARSFEMSKAAWMGNSVMEIYSAKAFDDISTNDSFTLTQFSGYTAKVTVAPKDVDLANSSIEDGDAASNYKEISAVISGPAAGDILSYRTLRSNCTQEAPYISEISTAWASDFAESGDDVVINVAFNREIDVEGPENIVLNLNVAERTGSQENYSVSAPDTPINVPGGTLAGNRKDLSFTYTVAANHTSSALDNYLDVSSIDLSGATITGFDGSGSDGCYADPDLPSAPSSTLADDQVIIRLIPAVYYIFHDWTSLQSKINPVDEGDGITPVSAADIFDKWKRFDGNNLYNSVDDAPHNSNARQWTPIYDDDDNLLSFYMDRNVWPNSGFISPVAYENLILETTLYSQFPRKSPRREMRGGDDDMIGVIIAYERGTDLCNNASADHDPATCSNQGGTQYQYIIAANRTGGGVVPRKGWGLVYGKTGDTSPAIIGDYRIESGGYWHGRFVRVKIVRENNTITAYSTTMLPYQDDDNNGIINSSDRNANDKSASRNYAMAQPYEDGDAILTVDLSSNRKYHKFVKKTGQDPPDTGSPFGFITLSQPEATYFDNVIPEPESETVAITGYVIYFHERVDRNDDGIYESWADFDIEEEDCCATEAGERNHSPSGSGIWKYNDGTSKWAFQEGLDIQELNAYYGITSPNPDGESDPVEENGKTTKYFIKKTAENQ